MIVVTGATGNVGLPLVRALAAAGERVTAVSRGSSATSLPEGVQHRPADLAVPESLTPALDAADALFLLVAGAGAHVNPHAILEVAKRAGVGRIVLLSSQAAGTRPHSVSHSPLRGIEDVVRGSGLDWTILRPGGFHSNTLAWAPMIRTHRTVAAPFGDVRLPSVDPADIADVAAAALRGGDHAGHTYVLTGPVATSPRDRARVIGEALGEPVRFVELSRDEARAQMLQIMPEPVVDGTLTILGEPLPAEQRISPDIDRILGRPPRTFADWVSRTITAFR